MNERSIPTLKKWPFYVADVLLLGFAFWILRHYPHPLPLWAAVLMAGSVLAAAFLGVLPHRMEYQTSVRFAEGDGLAEVVTEIGKLERIGEQVRLATGQWQGVQEHATRTVTAAREISDRITAEARSFTEFMQKANDSEKAALRLEAEKLRRGEGQWLQVLVHLLDHVFALHQAGVRSGQTTLLAQLGQFQEACRDIARRVGLTPFEPEADELFDENRHQLADGQPPAAPASRIAQTIASGYTYQGQLLRRSLVVLHGSGAETEGPGETATVLAEAPEATDPSAIEMSVSAPDAPVAGADLDPLLQADAGAEPLTPGSEEPNLEPGAEESLSFRLEAELLPDEPEKPRQA